MRARTVIDLGRLGPDWRWLEAIDLAYGYSVRPANRYYVQLPASVAALPVVNGVTRLALPEGPPVGPDEP